MAKNGGDVNKSSILYELLVLSEWFEDYDNTEYPWHLAVSRDGKVVAILQETLLEIKTAKDEYSSTVGKTCIPSDQCPKLRKLAWSPDSSFLAVARDNGVIYVFNLFGCNVATFEPAGMTNGVLQPVVGLCFLQSKFKSTKWSNELLIIYCKGDVRSILLSCLDGQESDENIKFSLNNYYPNGISAVAYDMNNLLIVAGTPSLNENGITVWRILNDYPYLKLAFEVEKFSSNPRTFLRLLPGFSNQNTSKTVFKMSVSPNGQQLACLHLSGEISLWRMPGIVLLKKWGLQEQPEFNRLNPEATETVKNNEYFYPIEIGWWLDSALVIARRSGAISICTVSTLDNILGESPEFLAQSPQIACVESDRSSVIALECETSFNCKTAQLTIDKESETSMLQESIQAALYSFTDIERFEPKRKTPKVTQKTYRMIAIKKTTPEELYTRKIDKEEYEEALVLAHKYNLDCDLVYQKRWRNSSASKENIHEYLEKIKKIVWVVNECVERVPDELEDARELLEFGLKKTNIKLTFNKLTADERQLVKYRTKLLKFSDSLTIYEKIIGFPKKYNRKEYDNFRKQDAIEATVCFARQENWLAVSIMFTHMGDTVLPHQLPILSNFPETLRPLQYRSLLPEIVDNEVIPWETKKLRDLDWSEKAPFLSVGSVKNGKNDEILYKDGQHLKQFQADKMTPDIVEEWYKMRTYEIEKNTGLVEHALSFVGLGRERGVRTLNKLHGDLLTLEALVYLVRNESVTLKELEAMNHLDQCKLLLSTTTKQSFITDLKNLLVPFSKRCTEQRCHTALSLVRDILLHFSEHSLELSYELLNYLKEGYMNPFPISLNETVSIVLDCLYTCPKSDQLETCFLILECLPQRSNNMSKEDVELHNRIDRLEVQLEICEVLERYETPKSVRFLHENENNEEVGKKLMNNMAEFTKRETLDFVELLADFELLQSKIFPCISENFCRELRTFTQLTCECEEIIQSTEEFIECRKSDNNKTVTFEKSVELVLKAARSHFEKATTFDDHYIELAQICLRLIEEPHPQVCEELDLIEAVQLLGDFDIHVLPLQVRKHNQRIKLVEACLTAKPKNYRSCQRLLQLAQTLRIYGEDRTRREGEVLIMIAQFSLGSSDFQYCSEICGRLVTRNYSPAWTVVKQLANCEDYTNRTNKLLLLAFSILHCPIENIEELIESRINLQEKYFDGIEGF
ncbi:hypothetical protein RUM44_005664 [Polyplax serrata]|uniref:Neuroblastoma-amplified sequence n=1 Tax=Polyplax serrata TaxID=468196 RepID=A0ABR1AW75_POLSC